MDNSKEIVGTIYSVEWLTPETMRDGEEMEPGTYVTIKVPDDSGWRPGKVAIRYVEGENG